MNMHYTNYGPHPPINLSSEQLREVVIQQFEPNSKSFQFQNFCDLNVLTYLKANALGLVIPANTTYAQGLDRGDCMRVREIIWDLIIDRYLTVGAYDYDNWPHFSITERGHVYFQECNTNI